MSMAPKGTKRRLKLMNEVLPSPGPEVSDSPRARTLAHLARLMSAAALASACSKDPDPGLTIGYQVVDPLPHPSDTNTGRKDSGLAPPPPTGIPENAAGGAPGHVTERSTGGAKTKPPKRMDRGYAVVDPLPSPPSSAKPPKGDPFGF